MKKNTWDHTFDVVVVGTGASGLTAALRAEYNGMRTLILEKMGQWGGSTAYSGGGVWIPNNHIMNENGALDSEEEALEYLDKVVGDEGPATSRERKEAFVKKAPEMALFFEEMGFKWARADLYPDYYPLEKGAKTGRVLEGEIFDGKKLGALRKSQLSMPGMPNVPIRSADAFLLPMVTQTWRGFSRVRKIAGKTISWKVRGKVPLGMGRSLTGQLMYIIQSNYQTPVWLKTPLKEVIMEDGRVQGVVVEQDGKELRIRANKGVLLGAGGFPHNDEYRKKHQGVGAGWSSAAPGNTGDGIQAGERVGGSLAMMDEAWWGGSFFLDGKINFSVYERSFPGCILVDRKGERFVNESTSYVDLGRKMLDRDKEKGDTIPSWLILDGEHRKRYLFGMMAPGSTPSKYLKNGEIVKADSIEELIEKCELDQDTFKETVRNFNSYAYHGKDEAFGRGNDIYDRYYSDYRVMPNSNLAPIIHPPFYAVRFYPGDLGTKGGLLTDELGRVLREDGSVLKGLYASGNNTASVMGRTYPGPGASIAPACTFSYIAMDHLAGEIVEPQKEASYEAQG